VSWVVRPSPLLGSSRNACAAPSYLSSVTCLAVFSFVLPLERIFDPRGKFELRGLSTGFYFLRFRKGDTTIATSDVELSDGNKIMGPLSVVAKSKGGSESGAP
jgi:hypothetical protein